MCRAEHKLTGKSENSFQDHNVFSMTKGKHRTYADHIDNYRRGGMRFGVLGGKLLHRLGRDIDMKELLPQLGATQGGTEMNVMKNPLDAISALAGLAQSRNDPMAALSALSALSGRPASAASGAAGASGAANAAGAAASGAASGGANPADLLSLLATLKPPQRTNAAPNSNSASGASGNAANGGDQTNRSGNAPGGTGFAGQSSPPYGEQAFRYNGTAQGDTGGGAAQAYAADGFGSNGSAPYARYEQRSAPNNIDHANAARGREGFATEEPYERSRADAYYAGYERRYNDFREENRQMPPHERTRRSEQERDKTRRGYGYDSLRERAERIYQREPHDACEHCEEPCGFRNYPSWKQVNMQTAPWRHRH